MHPPSFTINDCTISIEDGSVHIRWDHGDHVEVYDGGGYLVASNVNGPEIINGEYSDDTPP